MFHGRDVKCVCGSGQGNKRLGVWVFTCLVGNDPIRKVRSSLQSFPKRGFLGKLSHP